MTTTINASTSNGLVTTADTSGNLALQANGTTIATAQSTGLNLASTGLVFSDSTTQTSGSGVAKAWVNVNIISGASVINASYNISSVTYNATGDITVNFTNAFVDANYIATMCAGFSTSGANPSFLIANRIASNGNEQAPTTTAMRFSIDNTTGNANNVKYAYIAFFR